MSDARPHRQVLSDASGTAGPQIQFLTVAEVATLMRVSKMSVYRLIHSGDLEAARFGRNFRVPESAVASYLKDSYFEAG